MFDFAWSEIAVIGVIALVVIGPKDLPKALKTAGFMVRRARLMAREFQNSVDDMIRDSELNEIREQAAKAAGVDDLKQAMREAVDAGGEIRTAMAEPLGGTLAQEAAPPPPTVEGSAIGALPTESEHSILDPAIKPPASPALADIPGPDKDVPPDLHRTPPAP
ncbi:MAG TPA: Sec-independent protein translocase protein TatB [Aliidongia sp.]|uniref:Sec-independent protein translocase protein TatB n=1 Tax=Aliidongia sp. TaxID=1914230 RepID=UPI002DDC902D|nr:Sec-independent protein translocase protein TatB [Aliidongia sp.]HEV2678133.1 Sec-independent protein translocase protein TatB [Aliidongia sp.]